MDVIYANGPKLNNNNNDNNDFELNQAKNLFASFLLLQIRRIWILLLHLEYINFTWALSRPFPNTNQRVAGWRQLRQVSRFHFNFLIKQKKNKESSTHTFQVIVNQSKVHRKRVFFFNLLLEYDFNLGKRRRI